MAFLENSTKFLRKTYQIYINSFSKLQKAKISPNFSMSQELRENQADTFQEK